MTEQTIGERMREAFDGIDMKAAMRLVFGRCPECGEKLVRGYWLRWCPDRACQGYSGPLNQALGNKIETVKPRTPEETEQLRRLGELLEVETS